MLVLPMIGCSSGNVVDPNRKDFLSSADRKNKQGKHDARNRPIKLVVVVPLVLAFVAASAAIVDRLAERATATPQQVLADDYCIKCHTNDKVLSAIRSKSGNPKFGAAAVARYKAMGQWDVPKDATHSQYR